MHRVVASWFGTGLILGRLRGSDLGSGTMGSLFALPVALVVGEWAGWAAQLLVAVVITGLSLWSSAPFTSDDADPGWVCIDEAAGTFVCVIGLSFGPAAVVAWVVFRLADVFKELAPGVAQAERKLPGPVGVTADDTVAAIYGLAAGHLVSVFL